MDIAITFIIIFVCLMLSVYKGIFIFYPLFLGLVLFLVISARRGFKLNGLLAMAYRGAKKSLLIVNILLLIGAITAVWRASGTVSYIVYYGIRAINPHYFILAAFILSSLVSFLLGTSFGTVGTVGVILMVMVKSGNANINAVAGAIIAGAYFGDRCSPMSSSANLVATVTGTELYKNLKNMFKTSAVPFVLALGFYTYISQKYPLISDNSRIGQEIINNFNISFVVIIPALIILILAAFKVDVKLSMLISVISAAAIGVIWQHQSVMEMLKYTVFGYTMPDGGFLADIMKGGGVVSMLKVMLIILTSSAYSGIFEGTGLLKELESGILRFGRRFGVFFTTIVVSIASASFGCSQTLAIMLTYQLVKNMYAGENKDDYELVVDIENTVIVISALIPWNIAAAIPAAALSANAGYIAYAGYLYLLPLVNWIGKYVEKLITKRNIEKSSSVEV